MSIQDLSKLINYLEENLRASEVSGLNFVDTKNYRERLLVNQNHVIFGRRGAGKSSLIASLKQEAGSIRIKLNLEDYKDISFPNIIIHALKETFEQLNHEIGRRFPIWKFNYRAKAYRKKLEQITTQLNTQLHEPDESEESHKVKNYSEGALATGVGSSVFKADANCREGLEQEVARSVAINKLEFLKKELPNYKKLINEVDELIKGIKITLIFDDFYFVPKSVQPDFIDYFHRLTKGTCLFLKVATIKHRSRLYKQTRDSYIGVELRHDIYDVDLDYTLDKFSDLQSFMKALLENACRSCGVQININNLFSGEGFSQLCLASGGVPRDFLSLFVVLASKIVNNEVQSIGKVDVNEVAISNIQSKYDSLKTDSAEEREVLEEYLRIIHDIVYAKARTNIFLVAKNELEEYPQERQAIRELVDLRLIHLVDANTSCAPSDGRRYEAYMIDVGLYENSRPRNFTQVEPGVTDARSRKDELRASPRVNLTVLRDRVKVNTHSMELIESGIPNVV